MQENISSQKNSIIAVVAVLVVLAAGYMWYSSNKEGNVASTATVDPVLLSPDVAAFYNAKSKINLKDLSFMDKTFYKRSVDYSVEIPLVKPKGRPNPFVPYVTP